MISRNVFLVVLSFPSFIHAGNSEQSTRALRDLIAAPSVKTLETLRKTCKEGNPTLGYESNEEMGKILVQAAESNNIWVLRGLALTQKCSDGASRLSLRMALGNETLMKSPALLIQAIEEEKLIKELGNVTQMESTEWFAIDCQDDAACKAGKKKFWDKKRSALKGSKIDARLEPIRAGLLKAIPE